MSAPRQWHKAFVKLPAAWRGLSYFQRSIMQDLWRLSDADCSGRIEVDGDPAQFLVRDLDIVGRRDRSNAVQAVRELIRAELITIEGSFAIVRVERTTSVRRTTDVRTTHDRRTETADLCASVVTRTEPNSANTQQSRFTEREKEENREREHAHTRAKVLERAPVGEPPPELPPAEPPLASTIIRAHAAEYVKRLAGIVPPQDNRSAFVVAQWCEANAGAYKLSAQELALRVVAGLFASPRAAEKRWRLSWAANDAAEYAGNPPGVVIAAVPQRASREQLQEAREAVSLAAREVQRLELSPWFDKEEKGFPRQLADAQKALAAAHARVNELMRDDRVRAAS